MTGNEIKQEIIELFIKEQRQMTAKEITRELMLEHEKQKVSQSLSVLKSDGILTANRDHCGEDDAIRNFYELNHNYESSAIESAKKEPVKPLNITSIEEPDTEKKEVEQPAIQGRVKSTKTIYQIEVCGEYVSEFDTLEEAKEKAETIAMTEKEPVDIVAVEIHKVGTVKPVITTEFLEA